MYSRAVNGYTNILCTEKPPHTALRGFAAVLCRSLKATNKNPQLSFSRLSRLISLVRERGKDDPIIIQRHGRAMVFWNDDKSAQIAYSHAVRYINGQCSDFGGICCDGCGQPIIVNMGLHVCRQCVETDLCDRCMADYTNEALLQVRCTRHSFFHVDMAPACSFRICGVGGHSWDKRMD